MIANSITTLSSQWLSMTHLFKSVFVLWKISKNWIYIDDEMLAQYHNNQGFTQNFWKVEGDAEVLVDKWEARSRSRDQPRPIRHQIQVTWSASTNQRPLSHSSQSTQDCSTHAFTLFSYSLLWWIYHHHHNHFIVITCSLWKAAPPSSLPASWDLGHLAEIKLFILCVPFIRSPHLLVRLSSHDLHLTKLTRDWILVRIADTS